jgi:hypothetical protein
LNGVELDDMRYRMHYSHPIHGSFGIVVDDESMTWVSDPPGTEIAERIDAAYFSREGVNQPGSGRVFTLFPGGRAQPG